MGGEGERVVRKRVLGSLLGVGLLVATVPATVMADEQAGLLQGVPSFIRYQDPASGEILPVAIDCQVLVRLESADGSASEWQACAFSDEAEQPLGAVTPPATPVVDGGAECVWSSDYWATTDGSTVPAATYELTVTPAGHVYISSTYPAEPLTCPEG